MKKKSAFILAILMLFALLPAQQVSAFDANPTMRIGLYYGSEALASANLQNFAGSGYRFGYFDSNRDFIQLATTDEEKITMVPAGSGRNINVVVTGTSTVVYRFDSNANLAVWPDITENSLPMTWFKGYKYGGAFEYVCSNGSSLSVINHVTMQDYIKGVIPYEMSPSFPIEALKAQALCARSYAMVNINKHKSGGFDLCATDDCQVYKGFNTANEVTNTAVDETYGDYVTYQGNICHTFYHSSSGGYTENSENVWPNALPYLKAVPSPYEDLANITNGTWTVTYTNQTVKEILNAKGHNIGTVTNIYVDAFTAAGNVFRLVVEDANGKQWKFERESARTILTSTSRGLRVNSMRFTIGGSTASSSSSLYLQGSGAAVSKSSSGLYAISSDGINSLTGNIANVSLMSSSGVSSVPQTAGTVTTTNNGVYEIRGSGWGHNVGMSQWGAKGMADAGYAYDQIIKHYFTGVEIS